MLALIHLYFLTKNKHKIQEAENILNKYNISVNPIPPNVEKIEIQSANLEEIVNYAALHAIKQNICNFFVEDAGLFIDSLNGFPGPYSSYVFKTIGNVGILKLMERESNRRAYFQSTVGLCFNGELYLFTERVYGLIADEMRGDKGFGFDPIFIPDGYDKTFAEMDINEKNHLSHRGKALRKMAMFIREKIKQG